jgi:hypothetical protein
VVRGAQGFEWALWTSEHVRGIMSAVSRSARGALAGCKEVARLPNTELLLTA